MAKHNNNNVNDKITAIIIPVCLEVRAAFYLFHMKLKTLEHEVTNTNINEKTFS